MSRAGGILLRKHPSGPWHYRRAAPEPLRRLVGLVAGFDGFADFPEKPCRVEFTCTTGTRDPQAARKRAARIDARVQAALDEGILDVAFPAGWYNEPRQAAVAGGQWLASTLEPASRDRQLWTLLYSREPHDCSH